MRRFALAVAVLGLSPVWVGLTPSISRAAEPSVSAVPDAAACANLARTDFGYIPDAPTNVNAAQLVAATGSTPAYCKVEGYVAPTVGIQVHLPTTNWNGKFLQYGCGGFCGSLNNAILCDTLNQRGYACVVTDMGHKSTGKDAKWAHNNLQGEVDFGFRATHVALLAGREIAKRYYQASPRYSYFMGCSTGGRQALVSAQRFPSDFDGIIGGAPPISHTGDGLALAWTVQSLSPRSRPLFTPAQLAMTNKAVVKACDLNDGSRDGLIGDPRQCKFDPGSLRCAEGGTGDCLNAAQVEAIRKVYVGPVDSRGRRIFTGGLERGSEYAWPDFLAGVDGSPSTYDSWMREEFRYMAFNPDPGPSWDLNSFDWDRDFKRLGMAEALYDAPNPDLRRFKASGAKFILYQGWLDRMVMPSQSVDYYEAVERVMGGPQNTRDFMRLFMLPDVDHCIGGPGADLIDYLSALEAWVERGEAPDSLLAIKAKPDPDTPDWRRLFPIAADQIEFSRPVFPYPARTVYRSGDPTKASSYRAAP